MSTNSLKCCTATTRTNKQEADMRAIVALALPLIAAFGTSGLMFTATLV
jgi:hypothetical protein